MVFLIAALAGTIGALGGLAFGAWVCYLYLYIPTMKALESLTLLLADMKKQGFVRQFDFEQSSTLDPSAHIRDW